MNMVAEQKHWDTFLKRLPTRKDERWKYTDFTPLLNQTFTSANKVDPTLFVDSINQHRLRDGVNILLVFINGQFQAELSDLNKFPQGVIACDLATAQKEHSELANKYLTQTVDAKLYPFASLNAEMDPAGLFLYIPAKYDMQMTVHLLFLVTENEPFAAHTKNVFVLDADSKLVVAEEYYGMTSSAYFMNNVTQIHVADNAKLEYVKIQHESLRAIHMANIFVAQKQNSQTSFTNISLGAEFARDDLVIKLLDKHAECQTNGFYHPRFDNQYVDNHIDIDHAAPNTNSTMLYKGILNNKSKAVFNGRLYVEKDAQKILAYQANHNLLLSNTAEVYSKPELEIYADDVKCKHGASTGQIDQDAIFYLRSRGIGYEEAVNMLLEGFADEILQKITTKGIKMRVLELL